MRTLLQWFIKTLFCKLIPQKIDDKELIARAIIYPIHFKNKLKRESFLPKKSSSDISTYRIRYSNLNTLKQLAISLAKDKQKHFSNSSFEGFAVINNNHLKQINSKIQTVAAEFIASPIDKNNKYIDLKGKKIFSCDSGLPFHSDLVYSKPVPDGEPATAHRMYSDEILKVIENRNSFYKDECREQNIWCGENFVKKVN